GPVRAELFVRSSRPHTDFFARLCDVDRAGRSTNVCDGILRLAPGRPAAGADGWLRIELALWPTAHRFRGGHRSLVQISGGAHRRVGRNPGGGGPLATGRPLVAAEQEVLDEPGRESAVVMTVVE